VPFVGRTIAIAALTALILVFSAGAAGAAETHHVVATLYNADDSERLLLNGSRVASVGYGQTVTVDLGSLGPSAQLMLETRNGAEGYAWGLRVDIDGSTVIDDKAGQVGVSGANGNDMKHPDTIVHRLQFTSAGEILERFNAERNEPSSWCGSTRSSDDLTHEVANGGGKWHVIYAYAQDAPNRFGSLSGYFASSALAAQGVLTGVRGKPLRYDLGTDCGSRYLDMSAARLRLTTAELNASEDKYTPVVADLVGQGFKGADKDYLVFMDSGGGSACGLGAAAAGGDQRTPDNGHNNDGAYAVLYRYASPDMPVSGGMCGGAALHEMLHTMGAVPAVAPHAFNAGHCNDASDDVMCSGPRRGGGPFLDYGSDDYWDPSGARLAWWTVNLDRFFCARTTCNNGLPTRAPLTGRELGPLDFPRYCKRSGATAALLNDESEQPQAAYHWRCNSAGTSEPIDVQAACRSQYGTSEGAAGVLDLDDAFSWRCLRDSTSPATGDGYKGGDTIDGTTAGPSDGDDETPGPSAKCLEARRQERSSVKAVRKARSAYKHAHTTHSRQKARARLSKARARLAKDRRRTAKRCGVVE